MTVGAEVDRAAVLDVGPLHLQHHVLQGVKLQEAADDTIVAEAHRIPVGALHRLDHDRPAADLASHPPENRVREDSSRTKSQSPPTPDEEAVLREEVGEVAPGPEGRRMIGSPFPADEGLLDRHAEQDKTDFCEQ